MVYIFESELPKNKSILFAITSIFGIGKSSSLLLCKKLGFSKNLKVKNLSREQIIKLIKTIELSDLVISSDLKKLEDLNTKKLSNRRITCLDLVEQRSLIIKKI